MKYITTIGEEQFTIDVDRNGEVTLNGEVVDADLRDMLDPSLYSLLMGGRSRDVRMLEEEAFYEVKVSGSVFEVVVEDERTRRLAGLKSALGGVAGEAIIKSPMPGVVVEVPVKPGQEVAKGDVLVILESMKMQNEFKSPKDGIIKQVRVAAGDKLEQNAVMVTVADKE
jgi:biotin carboxyl carrier protein